MSNFLQAFEKNQLIRFHAMNNQTQGQMRVTKLK